MKVFSKHIIQIEIIIPEVFCIKISIDYLEAYMPYFYYFTLLIINTFLISERVEEFQERRKREEKI